MVLIVASCCPFVVLQKTKHITAAKNIIMVTQMKIICVKETFSAHSTVNNAARNDAAIDTVPIKKLSHIEASVPFSSEE